MGEGGGPTVFVGVVLSPVKKNFFGGAMRGTKRYELTKEKYLLDPEIERLEEILEKFAEENPRDTALIWLALYTGARASEVLATTPSDLDPYERTVFIRGLKDSNNRYVEIPKWLFEKLQALSPQDPNNKIFPISYGRFHQIWLEYRPVKKKLHSLRHTFAIMCYRKSKDIRALQTLLGHRAWSNTLIYAQYEYSTKEMRPKLFWTK